MTVLIVLLGLALASFPTAFVWRSERVCRYQMTVIRRLSDAAQQDILDGNYGGWQWRYVEFEIGPGSGEMVWKFWRPLRDEKWYSSTAFMEPAV